MLSAVVATIAAHDLLRAGRPGRGRGLGRARFDGAAARLVGAARAAGPGARGRGGRPRPARRRAPRRSTSVARARGGARAAVHGRSTSMSPRSDARRRGVSLQDAARDVRLRALTALAGAHGATRVALGHQADDQAETVLFRIVRGTGIAGLAGIPYRRDIFVRPLLDVTRARDPALPAPAQHLRSWMIPSNADSRFARARIRHRILPALAEENPRVAEALRALAAAARGGAASARTPASIGRRCRRCRGARRRPSRGSPRAAAPRTSTSRAGARRGLATARSGWKPRRRGARPGRARRATSAVVIDGPGGYRWSAAGAVEVRDVAARGGAKMLPATSSTPIGSPGRW